MTNDINQLVTDMENVVTNEPDVKSGDRAEWLRQRRRGLGGSDAAAAVGHSPFKTAGREMTPKLIAN